MEPLTIAALCAGLTKLATSALDAAAKKTGEAVADGAADHWKIVKKLLGFTADPPKEKLDDEIVTAVCSRLNLREQLQEVLKSHEASQNQSMVANAGHNAFVVRGDGAVINFNNRTSSDDAKAESPEDADARAFRERTTIDATRMNIRFNSPPDVGSLRHLARFEGTWRLHFHWSNGSDPLTPKVLRTQHLSNVFRIWFQCCGAEWWLTELARPDTAMPFLECFDFTNPCEPVTTGGLRAITRPDSGLSRLSRLYLGSSNTPSAAICELARPDSGLRALENLDISCNWTAHECIPALVRPDNGLARLKTLELRFIGLTNEVGKELANSDSGLKALTQLSLASNRELSDEVFINYAQPDTGLRGLEILDLNTTGFADAGMAAFANPDSGFKAITTLGLERTAISDKGLLALAQSDAGLQRLKELHLSETNVTDEGVAALQKARPHLKIYRTAHPID